MPKRGELGIGGVNFGGGNYACSDDACNETLYTRWSYIMCQIPCHISFGLTWTSSGLIKRLDRICMQLQLLLPIGSKSLPIHWMGTQEILHQRVVLCPCTSMSGAFLNPHQISVLVAAPSLLTWFPGLWHITMSDLHRASHWLPGQPEKSLFASLKCAKHVLLFSSSSKLHNCQELWTWP